MVCQTCKEASLFISLGAPEIADVHHARCPGGTWCDCQHATDQSYLNTKEAK